MICLVFTVVLGIVMQLWSVPPIRIDIDDGQMITVTGTVYQKEIKYNNSVIYLEDVSILATSSQPSIRKEHQSTETLQMKQLHIENIMCYMNMEGTEQSLPCIGSTVSIMGEFWNFREATNPGEFDTKEYYHLLGIACSLQKAQLIRQSVTYHVLREALWQFSRKCASVYECCMNEQDASAMKAMLVGQKGELDTEIKKLYQQAGIAHLYAISGLHISLISGGIYKALRKAGTPIWLAALTGCTFLILYVMMTGISASSFRAIIMFLLSLLADCVGRTYDMLTALAVSAVLLLIEQPLYLYQTGFQLSFAAILGIGIVGPPIRELLSVKGFWGKVWSAFSASLSVSLATLPIQISSYYSVNIYSIFLNLFVIPCMSIILPAGGAGLFLGLCNEAAGSLILQICHYLLVFYEKSSQWTISIPGSIWITGASTNWQIVLYYIMLLGGVYLLHWIKKVERVKAVIRKDGVEDAKERRRRMRKE